MSAEKFYLGKIVSWNDDYSLFVEDVFGVLRHDVWRKLPKRVDAEYEYNPYGVEVDKKKIPHQERWQSEALVDVCNYDKLAIKSGKGVGKTAFASWLVFATLVTKEEAKCACTAPSSAQLFDCLWAECNIWKNKIRPLYRPLLNFVVTASRIYLEGREELSFATARTARREQPEALQGLHAKNMLLLVDEASGVDDEVYKAGEGTMSSEGAKTVLIGNPTRPTGYFFNCFNRSKSQWKTRTVSCMDSSLVTQSYIENMKQTWGEDSAEYRIGVLGEFPLGLTSGIVPLNLVESAIGDVPRETNGIVWGLDVARSGMDRTALAKRHGRYMPEKIKWWQGKDLMQTCGLVIDEYMSTPITLRPEVIVVDIIGLGAGVYDRLREQGMPVAACSTSRAPTKDGFRNLGVQLWFRARDWFSPENAPVIINDEDFIRELCSVEYDIDSSGKKYIPDKSANIGKSPDLADAFILTMMRNYDPAVDMKSSFRYNKLPEYANCDASYGGGGEW